MSGIIVARARKEDLPAIAEIERRSFSDPWSPLAFRRLLADPAVFFARARPAVDDRVIGYVVAWFVVDEGEIGNLAVEPESRSVGVGSALLDATLIEAGRRGTSAIYLEVRESNLAAKRLYDSRGFIEVGRRRAYYRFPVEDAVVLRREISPPEADTALRV